jgi:uncharacterized integral membrane protein
METNENRIDMAREGPAPGPDGETVTEYRGAGIMWTAVALIVALALFVVVALQNTHDVTFEVLWFDFAVPLILVIAITFAVALVIGEAVGFVWRRRRRRQLRDRDELRRLRRQVG